MPKLSKEQLEEIQQYIQTLPEEEREEKLNQIMSQFENQTPQCPFCLMAEGKIQTTNVYEDPNYLGVLEINPANPGHTILFTRKHITSFSALSNNDTENLFKIAKVLAHAISTFSDGVSLFTEDGKIIGKRFDHFVINILPRKKDDDIHLSTKPQSSTPEKLKDLRDKILSNLPKAEENKVEQPKPLDDSIFSKDLLRMAKRKP